MFRTIRNIYDGTLFRKQFMAESRYASMLRIYIFILRILRKKLQAIKYHHKKAPSWLFDRFKNKLQYVLHICVMYLNPGSFASLLHSRSFNNPLQLNVPFLELLKKVWPFDIFSEYEIENLPDKID